ncbi:MAG: DUF3553 domain-containing protein [Planctomycetota bacterium]
MPHRFAIGEKLRHTSKPEWGLGSVTAAQPQTHEGTPVQRLTIRFERAGLKTLSTAFAKLAPATETAPRPELDENGDRLPVETRDPSEVPDEAADASRPALNRLQAALAPYRWDGSWPGLLDWAATMTGLADPLAEHTRTDLEAAFQRQRVGLVRELRSIHAAMTPIERELSRKLTEAAGDEARRAWRTATERR